MKLFLAYLGQVLLAIDQLLNALIPPLTGTLSYADETLSARCYRAYHDGRILGRVFMPMIDKLFFWQDMHCRGAFRAEELRRQLPPSYRGQA